MKVLIQSFSYVRTGYPKDKTGKGGGFVFDCRTVNVFEGSRDDGGKKEFPFMHLTGQSPLIKDALDRNQEVDRFFNALWVLVEMEINTCLRFGFKIMTVNFGCTAGQHRSVYMAERLMRKVWSEFPDVDWELIHLEESYWPKS